MLKFNGMTPTPIRRHLRWDRQRFSQKLHSRTGGVVVKKLGYQCDAFRQERAFESRSKGVVKYSLITLPQIRPLASSQAFPKYFYVEALNLISFLIQHDDPKGLLLHPLHGLFDVGSIPWQRRLSRPNVVHSSWHAWKIY